MNASQIQDTGAGRLQLLKMQEFHEKVNLPYIAEMIAEEQRAKSRVSDAELQRALRECAAIRAKLSTSHTRSAAKRPTAATATRPVGGPTFSRPIKACNKVIG